VVVVPSWREERGRIVLEAMANGAPVVAARTGGIPETVVHGVNGLLVPPRDPLALAAAIDRVLHDDRLAASLAAAGLRTAGDHGVDRLVDATLNAYERALGRTFNEIGELAPA
jgi:glycosyltransferase involved in cell wall biosynthesis